MKKIFKLLGNILAKVKPDLKEEINEFSKEAVKKLKIKIENYDYSAKLNDLAEFVMTKIKLPLWLKPFKKVVKNVIKETLETFIEEVKEEVEKLGE